MNYYKSLSSACGKGDNQRTIKGTRKHYRNGHFTVPCLYRSIMMVMVTRMSWLMPRPWTFCRLPPSPSSSSLQSRRLSRSGRRDRAVFSSHDDGGTRACMASTVMHNELNTKIRYLGLARLYLCVPLCAGGTALQNSVVLFGIHVHGLLFQLHF